MTWFKVDDKAHSNSKIRKVLAEAPAAIALWTVAGSWSADNLQDGFVPDHQLPWLLPIGAEQLAQVLVTARLWRRVKGGYRFHQWDADGDGTRRNPTRAEVEAERAKKAEAGRKGGLASGKTRSRTEARASAGASAGATGFVEPPSRPDPTNQQQPSVVVPRKRGTRIPDDFAVTPDMVTWAKTRVPHVDGRLETEKFINYWTAKTGKDATKVDWPATWRNWMLNATERQGNGRNVPSNVIALRGDPRPSTTDQKVAVGLALADKYDALEAAKERTS